MDSINQLYLQSETLEQVRKAYERDPDFLSVAIAQVLTKDALERTIRECRRGWKPSLRPDRHSYAVHDEIPVQEDLRELTRRISGKEPLRTENLSLRHRDFTLLHDEEQQKAGVLGILFLDDWDAEWGGNIVFMKQGEVLGTFTPARNTLLIVRRKRGTRMFVQYVNHKAGKKSFAMVSA